jgi:hypothetical protein
MTSSVVHYNVQTEAGLPSAWREWRRLMRVGQERERS